MCLTSGGVQDPRVHSPEDLLLQEANDQLPDPTEHSAEVQVSTAVPEDNPGYKVMYISAPLLHLSSLLEVLLSRKTKSDKVTKSML